MNKTKTQSLLGFAAKAGKLSYGTHASTFAIESGRAKMVVVACDISQKTVKEIKFKAAKQNIPVIMLSDTTTQTLSHTVGKTCGIITVNDQGFADAITKQEEIAYDGKI